MPKQIARRAWFFRLVISQGAIFRHVFMAECVNKYSYDDDCLDTLAQREVRTIAAVSGRPTAPTVIDNRTFKPTGLPQERKVPDCVQGAIMAKCLCGRIAEIDDNLRDVRAVCPLFRRLVPGENDVETRAQIGAAVQYRFSIEQSVAPLLAVLVILALIFAIYVWIGLIDRLDAKPWWIFSLAAIATALVLFWFRITRQIWRRLFDRTPQIELFPEFLPAKQLNGLDISWAEIAGIEA